MLVLQEKNNLFQVTERDDFMLEEITAGVNRRVGELACRDEQAPGFGAGLLWHLSNWETVTRAPALRRFTPTRPFSVR